MHAFHICTMKKDILTISETFNAFNYPVNKRPIYDIPFLKSDFTSAVDRVIGLSVDHLFAASKL